MQCSNCKTENPPGSQVCFQCGNRFVSEKITLRPPFVSTGSIDKSYVREGAKDSQRLEYNNLNVHDRIIEAEPYLFALFWGLLSYIPSVGFFVNKQRKAGFFSLLALCILTGWLYLEIHSGIADSILYILGVFSVTSCYLFLITYLTKKKIIDLTIISRIGMIIVVIAVFTLMTALPFASFYRIAYINDDLFNPAFRDGDTIIVNIFPGEIRRNDVIAVSNEALTVGSTLALVVAVPGDTISYSGGKAYVNGEYVGSHGIMDGVTISGPIVQQDQYIVLVSAMWDRQSIQLFDIVNRRMIDGRAVAIMNPPERRRFV